MCVIIDLRISYNLHDRFKNLGYDSFSHKKDESGLNSRPIPPIFFHSINGEVKFC